MQDKIFRCLGASNHTETDRQVDDFYATHPDSTRALLKARQFDSNILEPACGMGHIVEVLKEFNYNVTAKDLNDYGYGEVGCDFFDLKEWNGDIITNPPYSMGLDFVQHALDIVPEGHKVVMFLKVQFLEGQKRYNDLYSKGNLKEVLIFTNRQVCGMNGVFPKASAVAYAWYIFEKGYKGKPTLDWLSTK